MVGATVNAATAWYVPAVANADTVRTVAVRLWPGASVAGRFSSGGGGGSAWATPGRATGYTVAPLGSVTRRAACGTACPFAESTMTVAVDDDVLISVSV